MLKIVEICCRVNRFLPRCSVTAGCKQAAGA